MGWGPSSSSEFLCRKNISEAAFFVKSTALVLSTETSQLAGPALKGLRALAEEECEVEAQKKVCVEASDTD